MHLRVLLVLPLTTALMACGPGETGFCADPAFRHNQGLKPVSVSHIHKEERSLNREILSYAGGFPSSDGYQVLLVEGASQQDIEKAEMLAKERAPEFGLTSTIIQTTAAFTFTELDRYWQDSIRFIFEDATIWELRVDPERNGIHVFVDSEETAEEVERRWAAHDLPPEALLLATGERPTYFPVKCTR